MAEPNGYIQGKGGQPIELVDVTARRKLAGKLDAPGNVKAGDYLRVQSIGADGTVVLEGAEGTSNGSGQNLDYSTAANKPSINGVTLEGNKTTEDLGLGVTDEQVETAVNAYLTEHPVSESIPDFSGYAGILFYDNGNTRAYNPLVNTTEYQMRSMKVSAYLQNYANGVDVLSTPGALAHESSYTGRIYSWVENVAGTTADVPNHTGVTAVKARVMRDVWNYPRVGDVPVPADDVIHTVAQQGDEALNTITGETFNIQGGVGYQTSVDGNILCGYVPDYAKLKGMTIPVSVGSRDALNVGTRHTWTMTIDGELGDYNYSRLPSPARGATLHPSNQVAKIGSTYYRADAVPNNGFVLLSSTDLINWVYIAHVTLPDGFTDNTATEVCCGTKGGRLYVAMRQLTDSGTLYLAKLNADFLSINSIVAVPDCGSKPHFVSFTTASYPHLFLVTAPVDRYSCRVYDIVSTYGMNKIIPLFELVGNVCNYPFLHRHSQYLYVCGTNGAQTDKNGVSVLPLLLCYSALTTRNPHATDVIIKDASGDVLYGNLYELPPAVTWYKVDNALTNVTTSNIAKVAQENAAYSATLTAADGYTLDSVTVTMGGVDITETAHADGTVTVESVTGNIVITASATATTE